MDLYELIILIASGAGAGVATGLIGASAVIVAAPILLTGTDITLYAAVGLSLATDVVSSLTATGVYYRHRHIDIKRALPVLVFALVGVVIGSIISVDFPATWLGIVMGVGAFSSGIAIFTGKRAFPDQGGVKHRWKLILASVLGLILGLNAGIFGAGGGIMILLILTLILGYQTHTAIGTSVFLMVIIALFGSVIHYVNLPFSFIGFSVMAISGAGGAIFSSTLANHLDERVLNRTVGGVIVVLGIMLVIEKILSL